MKIPLRQFVLLLSPVLPFAVLLYYCVSWNVWFALTNYSLLNPVPRFAGLQSFIEIFSDPRFLNSLQNTLLWALLLVALGNTVGLLLASAIFQFTSSRVRSALTTFFIYPLSLSLVVVGITWRWLFDAYKGFNVIFSQLGLPQVRWLEGQNAFWSMVLVSLWVYTGFIAMLYLGMFYNVDRSTIESAMVDGADMFTIMARIVIPASRQGLIISTVFLLLFGLQMFDLPYTVLYLNPFTMTVVMYSFERYVAMYFYQASAAALVLVMISAFIVIPYSLYGLKRWVMGR
ncbi:carbohydrate ABC transporter permease [Infirmifilum sp. NZ]|uniref:carbohydrate ABC transporter permease n=1 Tax=Infirmifilum sp. NZ TaxID=2926850 RepID=UPI0027A23F45|nr:sugar ABC transporter permease [Infirmifilum sp. NZ]UNQ73805.1 sugar ABC transporter permease [Infirmifilum sp. NZ]